jgi:hypothetical protein
MSNNSNESGYPDFPDQYDYTQCKQCHQIMSKNKHGGVFAEFDTDIILFLIIGFALRDLIQSGIQDILIPSVANVFGIEPFKSKVYIPWHNANPIHYGDFLESIFGFFIVIGLIYFFIKRFD